MCVDIMRGVSVSVLHELSLSVCVCLYFVCAAPELTTDSSSCNSHRTNGVKGFQNCTDWKARSEVMKAAKHIQRLKSHLQQRLFVNQLGPENLVNR